eukprot:scaffold79944_cov29-Tisochrysis_lutea.AAC.6
MVGSVRREREGCKRHALRGGGGGAHSPPQSPREAGGSREAPRWRLSVTEVARGSGRERSPSGLGQPSHWRVRAPQCERELGRR